MFCGSTKENMKRSGYTNAERAQCVIWISQGNGVTEFQRLFQSAYKGILHLYLRYGNCVKTIKKEDLIIIEGEMDARE